MKKIFYYLLVLFISHSVLTACGSDDNQPDINDIGSRIKEYDDLVTMAVKTQKVVIYDSDKEIWDWNSFDSSAEQMKGLFGKRMLFMTVPATLYYGYDLNKVDVTTENGKLVIKLPESPVFLEMLDEKEIKLDNVKRFSSGLRDDVATTKIRECYDECRKRIKEEADLLIPNIRENAKFNARYAIQYALKGTLWEENFELKFSE